MLAAIVENSAGRWPSAGSARGLRHTIGHTRSSRLALWGVVAVVRHVVHRCGHVSKADRWPVVVRGVCDRWPVGRSNIPQHTPTRTTVFYFSTTSSDLRLNNC